MPPRRLSAADLNAAIERVAPEVLAWQFRRVTGEEVLRQSFRFALELAYGNAG